jgi:hypothetical protein
MLPKTSRGLGTNVTRRCSMRFVFRIKTKSGSFVDNVHVEARDQKEAEQKVIRENPSCTIVKCDKP